jgi:mono/diheme cytochrome c family protein
LGSGNDNGGGRASRGKQLYSRICSVCHGPDGDKLSGKNLKTVRTRMNPMQLETFIRNPPPAMPRIFNEPPTAEDARDIRDIVAYLSAWQ